jgi:plastocyanin
MSDGTLQTAPRVDRDTGEGTNKTPTLDWRRLLVRLALALPPILMVGMLAVGEFLPPIVILAALLLVAGLWSRRSSKGGPILVGLLLVAVVGIILTFNREAITVPASTVDFLWAAVASVIAAAALVAVIGVLSKGHTPSRLPRAVALTTVVLVGLLAGVAVAGRIAYDEATPALGDIALSTQDMEFMPATITAPSGEITVFVHNQDNVLHTLTIDELGVDLLIPANTKANVTFNAEPGTYEIVCVPHEGMGMTGTLKVEERDRSSGS